MDYILQKDVDFFGKKIKAGTRYAQHGADYWWPVIDGAHCPSQQVDFMTVRNNPDYFQPQITACHFGEHDVLKGNCGDAYWYQFCLSQKIDAAKRVGIMKAIEAYLNLSPNPKTVTNKN